MSDTLILSMAIILFIILGITGYALERHEWNKGICRSTGRKWKFFSYDSQGGRGYTSDDYYCWISYPWIDKDHDMQYL